MHVCVRVRVCWCLVRPIHAFPETSLPLHSSPISWAGLGGLVEWEGVSQFSSAVGKPLSSSILEAGAPSIPRSVGAQREAGV